MEKDFDRWNEQKKLIHEKPNRFVFRRREIRWCRMGINVGYEQNGKGEYYERPVLIIRKLGKYTFFGIPITTKNKQGFIYHPFYLSTGSLRIAIIGQLRVFDTRRLTTLIDRVTPHEFFAIIKAVQNLIEPLDDVLPKEKLGHASLEKPEANT